MQGFRRAFVLTGFVILGLGSNLAWHYPRPELLGLNSTSPQGLMAYIETLQNSQIRCRPNMDWSQLLVEASDKERALETLKTAAPPAPAATPEAWSTPPDLLAELAHLPGVKEANVVLHEGREAVVMLSMQHGAFAGDRILQRQAVQTVQAYKPTIKAENVKLLDGKGADLNYSAINFPSGKVHPLQIGVQSQLDGLLGPHRALFLCRLQRSKARRITLQSVLYLKESPEEPAKAAQELAGKALQNWVDEQNVRLSTDKAWQVQAEIYPYLEDSSYRRNQRNWRQDRESELILDPVEVKEWTLVQRTLPLEERKVLEWGLTSPPPTPGQLALGLTALAPALFGWCLLLPWLLRRHQLSSSASATL
ncbi:MAG: hypothetical protein KF760_22375 [Candidatus Eremiobacteraeota bacterium]|nr:hypothetical protein [Candidatus Eremiobacteraeota bacterium]MCW5866427.1 hypothetical protein [Candidatus Eremiobacteraeota bacterium]